MSSPVRAFSLPNNQMRTNGFNNNSLQQSIHRHTETVRPNLGQLAPLSQARQRPTPASSNPLCSALYEILTWQSSEIGAIYAELKDSQLKLRDADNKGKALEEKYLHYVGWAAGSGLKMARARVDEQNLHSIYISWLQPVIGILGGIKVNQETINLLKTDIQENLNEARELLLSQQNRLNDLKKLVREGRCNQEDIKIIQSYLDNSSADILKMFPLLNPSAHSVLGIPQYEEEGEINKKIQERLDAARFELQRAENNPSLDKNGDYINGLKNYIYQIENIAMH